MILRARHMSHKFIRAVPPLLQCDRHSLPVVHLLQSRTLLLVCLPHPSTSLPLFQWLLLTTSLILHCLKWETTSLLSQTTSFHVLPLTKCSRQCQRKWILQKRNPRQRRGTTSPRFKVLRTWECRNKDQHTTSLWGEQGLRLRWQRINQPKPPQGHTSINATQMEKNSQIWRKASILSLEYVLAIPLDTLSVALCLLLQYYALCSLDHRQHSWGYHGWFYMGISM